MRLALSRALADDTSNVLHVLIQCARDCVCVRVIGTDINLHGHSQLVALHEACVRNNTPVIQWLLEKRAKPNEQDKYVALSLSLSLSLSLVVGSLSLDGIDRRGETPLHYAVRNQNKDVAVLLLLHHADKNIASLEGHSALDLARQSGFNALETGMPHATRVPACPLAICYDLRHRHSSMTRVCRDQFGSGTGDARGLST